MSFEGAGKYWGEHLRKNGLLAGQTDPDFVNCLKDRDSIDYFHVHSDLKEAFKKGFRLGFEERVADLVLGPNLTAAAEAIGRDASNELVGVVNKFESDWATNIRRDIDTFITLISEGSQADREAFIKEFTRIYQEKWIKNRDILNSKIIMTQVSEGGTMLYLDYSKGKTLGALNIPTTEALKTEIYHQTFKVMGDEWGRRYSTNLIPRGELVELLRKSKTAMEEVQPYLAGNLGIIRDAFCDKDSYGTDAQNVFASLLKEAGYTVTPVSQVKMMNAPKSDEPPVETVIKEKDLPKRGNKKYSKYRK